jgi:hypothetical protein
MKEALWYGFAAGSGGAIIAALIIVAIAIWPEQRIK